MKYYAVDFKITCDEELMQTCRELLADAIVEAGFESFEDTEHGLTAYVQCDLFDEPRLKTVLQEFQIPSLAGDGGGITYTVSDVDDQDWNEAWEQEGFDPIFIDDRCVIYDARRQNTPLSSLLAPLRIGIEARMAFGTGTHETTRMVVGRLLALDLTGKRVLDCGCGTGILSIVAAKAGASEVVGYDIDEWSVENSYHNAELNGITNIDFLQGDASVLSHICGVFDVIVANINRNILLQDLPHFREVMAADGLLILSGFYEEDIPMLTEAAVSQGLKVVETSVDSQWACVSFKGSEREVKGKYLFMSD